MILEIEEIDTYYGQSHVLQGISLSIDEGEVVSLLGRNGVGKTTTLRSIMGLTPPKRGSIKFQGKEIADKQSFEIARLGIGYVPDDRRIFPDLTAFENLEIARRMSRKKRGFWNIDTICDLFPVLRELGSSKGTHLSGGEQKMLAIGRALMKNPLMEVIKRIRDEGVTILLADQNLKFCKGVADRGYILEKGMIQYEGTMNEIWGNEEVVSKYLVV